MKTSGGDPRQRKSEGRPVDGHAVRLCTARAFDVRRKSDTLHQACPLSLARVCKQAAGPITLAFEEVKRRWCCMVGRCSRPGARTQSCKGMAPAGNQLLSWWWKGIS